jgi:hypothetical protein
LSTHRVVHLTDEIALAEIGSGGRRIRTIRDPLTSRSIRTIRDPLTSRSIRTIRDALQVGESV